ncbi:signal peptide peptidase SppA [Sphingomonas rubra]|uniref:Protease-4 n=1 Tax=Sphingomonas rubra TaxID=634430 RepID=A0A1I5QLJ2_9SPHN|nr:signal peptide peptidase SppA [Sphingomonas rubra]SFP47082.1 protease-4 [Sphingomonas rubra]
MTDSAVPPASFTDPAAPRRSRTGWRIVRAAWRLLVGVKDALVLLALLLFFGVLFAALNSRPGVRPLGEGALLLDLDGTLVEQPAEPAAFAALSGQPVAREFRLRDVVRAINDARTDARVKAIVLDLDKFGGGYPAAIGEVADALYAVRRSGKPVLAYATAYTDSGYRLAAAASEVWIDPLGGALFTGPGGTQLYYKGLIDRLGVNAHVYRVGRYKSFVEPFTRTDQSPDARAAAAALSGQLLDQWQGGVARMRPKAQVARYLAAPQTAVLAAGGDVARANLATGLVDRLGDRIAFGKRVAQLAGAEPGKPAGSFRTIRYNAWLRAHPLPTAGHIGVLTVAGDIVDGEAGPGTAAGDTVAKAMLDGLATRNLKAVVVRVDSPGGSVLASERIRQSVLEAKRRGLPVVVSMGGVAASGGYWVSTPGDVIFAEPATITGSIGIFGILPTFENTLAKIGVTSDGVRTTPLSGQPDVFAGTTPVLDAILQAGIENGYRQFIARVAQARRMTPARVDQIGQGRVWDGGTARQLGLVDRFGSLSDAVAEAARLAKIDPKTAVPVYLEKEPGWAAQLAASFAEQNDDDARGGDAFARVAADRRALLGRALGDVRRLAMGGSVQARCLECAGLGPVAARGGDGRLLDLLLARIGW